MTMATRDPARIIATMETARAFFERGVKRQRKQLRITVVVLMVISAIGLAWGLAEDPTGDRKLARMVALSGIMLVVGPIVLLATLRRPRGLDALDTPERIVWCWGVGQGGYIMAVMVGLDDGKLHKLPMPHHSEAQTGMTLITELAPHATHGFSEELRKRFRSSPTSLRKA